MKKTFFVILIIILLAIGITAYIIDRKSRAAISDFLTEKLNTKVTLKGASLGFKRLVLEGLYVSDPTAPGQPALYVDRIAIDYELLSLLKETVVIDDLIIDSPTTYIRLYNTDGSDNNWATLLKGIDKGGPATQKQAATEPSRQFLVKELVIYNLKAELQHSLLGPYAVSLPVRKKIVIRNLNSNKPEEMKAQLEIIVAAIMQALSQYEGLGAILNSVGSVAALPVDLLKSIAGELDAQKPDGLLNSATGTAKDVVDEFQKGTERVKDFFSDLFRGS